MSTPPVRSSKMVSSGHDAAEARAAFGQWLRQQREVRGVELDEVARATKVSARYLEALEDGRFELLPAPVFARGFLREYARYVGLDADEAVNSYLTALQPGRNEEANDRGGRSGDRRWLAAGILAIACLVVAMGIWWWLGRQDVDSQAVSASPPPAAHESAPRPPESPSGAAARHPAEAPAAALVVTLDFRAGSWIEAEVDGQSVVSEERLQGESLTLRANERVRLSLDRPQSVDVLVNGQPHLIARGADGTVRDYEITLPEGPEAPPE